MADPFVLLLRAHQAVYERSDGLVGHRLLFGVPTLLLRSTGRRSGQIRTNALTYARDGDAYLVTASNGGSRRPPGWAHNLLAKQDAQIQVGRTKRNVVAQQVLPGDPDYDRMWEKVNKVNRGQYREYQKKTDRPIAIFALTPA